MMRSRFLSGSGAAGPARLRSTTGPFRWIARPRPARIGGETPRMMEYSDIVKEIIEHAPKPDLGEGGMNPEGLAVLESVGSEDLFPDCVVNDHDMAFCCLSGLFLLHDELDQSHKLSQQVKTPSGSFWHGIMHRREGDYSNAKYWFRNAGDHPVFQQLKEAFGEDYGDPFTFVDKVEQARGPGRPNAERCLEIQQREWQFLFDYCYARA